MLVSRSIYQPLIFKGFSIGLPEAPVRRAAHPGAASPCDRVPISERTDSVGPKTIVFVFGFRRPERPKTNRTDDGRACFVLNNYRYRLPVKKRTCARGPPGPACVIEILIERVRPSYVEIGYEHNRLRYVHASLSRTAVQVQGVLSSNVGRPHPTGEKIGRDPRLLSGAVLTDPANVFTPRLTRVSAAKCRVISNLAI